MQQSCTFRLQPSAYKADALAIELRKQAETEDKGGGIRTHDDWLPKPVA